MNTSNLKYSLSNIVIIADSDNRFFFLKVAENLKEKYNSKIWLYCTNKDEKFFYDKNIKNNSIISVNIMPSIYSGELNDSYDNLDDNEIINEAKKIEEYYNITISKLLISNRHLGRGFAPGGYGHPRSSYSEKSRYVDVLKIYIKIFKYWEKEFKDKSISLVLNGDKDIAIACQKHNIYFRCITESKIDNLYYWGWDEYRNSPQIKHIFSSNIIAADEITDTIHNQPYTYHLLNKPKVIKNYALSKLPILIAERILRQIWWKFKGRQKSKGYYLTEMIKLFIRRAIDWKKINNLNNIKIRDLENVKFIYFPLHVEPETALQTMSPEFYFQHAVICIIAGNLPAGYKLIIKENFGAVGRRPIQFYEQIADIKNIKFADPLEPGIEFSKKAHITVTITGTAGFEAAVNGNHVISFGIHNTYNLMDHVHVIKELKDVPILINKLLKLESTSIKSKQDGIRYYNSIKKISFDLKDYNFTLPQNYNNEIINNCINQLIISLDFKNNNLLN